MYDSLLKRFSVSMEEDLLRKFDHLVSIQGYQNRSEAVRDLVRQTIVNQSYDDTNQMIAGSVLLFYDHHQRNLMGRMTEIQHNHLDLILSTTHFHLNENSCLELIVVKGKAKEVQELSHKLTTLKGVNYGKFTVAPVEQI